MKKRNAVIAVASVITLVAALRLAAPFMVEYMLNERWLTQLGDYRGHVGDVDLAIWRGAVRIENAHIEKTHGKEWVDFIIMPLADIAISRRALLNGAVRLDIILDQPEVNFVDAKDPADRQVGKGFNWRVIPEDILKFSIEHIEVQGGTLAFRNFTSEPQVNLQARNINGVATNLTNIKNKEGENVSTAEVTATIFDDSSLFAKAEFDPFDLHSFIFAGEVEIADVTHLNNFAQAYANLDFTSGQGKLTMELEAKDGQLSGYAKPSFEDVEIADWEQDVERQEENLFRVAWEGMVGFVGSIFTNPTEDQIATRIDISGSIPDKPEINMWGAVFGIVRNAFAEAINTSFEDITPLEVPGEKDADNDEN